MHEPRSGDTPITFSRDDPSRPDVRALLEEHLADMYATSPAESVHALDIEALEGASIRFFTARDTASATSPSTSAARDTTGQPGRDPGAPATLLGCAALHELTPTWAELKSMRTATSARGRGVAAAMLEHLMADAAARGVRRMSLETGTEDYFTPARRLYERHGFTVCPPFANYRPDPVSVFYTRELDATGEAREPR